MGGTLRNMGEIFGTVVLGGGLAGIIAGLNSRQMKPSKRVLVVEGSAELGGALVGSHSFGQNFDLGTHIPQETGISRIDEWLERAIGNERLQRMSSSEGDRAGTLFGGHLYSSSAYPDLLAWKPELAGLVSSHIISNCSTESLNYTKNVRQESVRIVAENWFGNDCAQQLIFPLLQNWFGDLNLLSGFALEFTNLTRLRVVNETEWERHAKSNWFRERTAFPDQRALPFQYQHNRHSIYPKGGSSSSFVAGLKSLAESAGIEFQLNAHLNSINPSTRCVEFSVDQRPHQIVFEQLISTLGPVTTLKLLGDDTLPAMQRVSPRIVHHLVERPIQSDVCYAYVNDVKSPVFRITNYGAFAGHVDDCRLTTELLVPSDIDSTTVVRESEGFLMASELLRHNKLLRSAAAPKSVGFPSPQVKTFELFDTASKRVARFEDENLIVSGIGAEGRAFFQNEILAHLDSRIF